MATYYLVGPSRTEQLPRSRSGLGDMPSRWADANCAVCAVRGVPGGWRFENRTGVIALAMVSEAIRSPPIGLCGLDGVHGGERGSLRWLEMTAPGQSSVAN